MKSRLYLLFMAIGLTSMIACSKKGNDENARQVESKLEATGLTWSTYYSSPSVPNIKWGVSLIVTDTNAVKKITLYRVSPSYMAFEIDKPRTKTYSITQPGYKCPSYNDNAYFFLEWTMADGSKKKLEQVKVWEQ